MRPSEAIRFTFWMAHGSFRLGWFVSFTLSTHLTPPIRLPIYVVSPCNQAPMSLVIDTALIRSRKEEQETMKGWEKNQEDGNKVLSLAK